MFLSGVKCANEMSDFRFGFRGVGDAVSGKLDSAVKCLAYTR